MVGSVCATDNGTIILSALLPTDLATEICSAALGLDSVYFKIEIGNTLFRV